MISCWFLELALVEPAFKFLFYPHHVLQALFPPCSSNLIINRKRHIYLRIWVGCSLSYVFVNAFDWSVEWLNDWLYRYWASIPIPHGCLGFRATCPFCATPLAGEPGYVKLIFQDHVDWFVSINIVVITIGCSMLVSGGWVGPFSATPLAGVPGCIKLIFQDHIELFIIIVAACHCCHRVTIYLESQKCRGIRQLSLDWPKVRGMSRI